MEDVNEIKRVLIANRGEIARRIIKTCRQMDIVTIAVYADSDEESPFVNEADIAVKLGGKTPLETYLNQRKILEALIICICKLFFELFFKSRRSANGKQAETAEASAVLPKRAEFGGQVLPQLLFLKLDVESCLIKAKYAQHTPKAAAKGSKVGDNLQTLLHRSNNGVHFLQHKRASDLASNS